MDELKAYPKHDQLTGGKTPFSQYNTEELIREARSVLSETQARVWFRHDFITEIVSRMELLNRRPAPENKPLTLEQLRKMDGEPVWLETGEVTINEQIIGSWEILEQITTEPREAFWFTRRVRNVLSDNYGKTWLAYVRKPEQEGDAP